MFYFAYGSNMSLSRLRKRTPSAERIGACTLQHHDLRFHKHGADGSGKCDAFQTENSNDFVCGSLFRIDPVEKPALDSAEGLGFGYNEKLVSLTRDTGENVAAFTYYAIKINDALKPYTWYLQHVVIGAKESNCPSSYVSRIQAIESVEDRNRQREMKELAIHSGQHEIA